MLVLFTAKAVRLFFAVGGAACALLAAGAVLFAFSDCIIPLVHFVPRRSLAAHLLNLCAYYAGMFLISASLAFA